jgi:hypothetical protein
MNADPKDYTEEISEVKFNTFKNKLKSSDYTVNSIQAKSIKKIRFYAIIEDEFRDIGITIS